jgi:hypothetical protein
MGTGLSEEDVWARKNAAENDRISNKQTARGKTESRTQWRAGFFAQDFTNHPTSPLLD